MGKHSKKQSLPSGTLEPLVGADRTKQNHVQGESLYDQFAEGHKTKKIHEVTMEDLTKDGGQFVKNNMAIYATFLTKYMKTLKNGGKEHIKPGSQQQYLSNAKNAISKRHPTATIVMKRHPDAEWFNTLYNSLGIRATAEAAKRGDIVRSPTRGIRRKLLSRIQHALMSQGTPQDYENRHVLNTLYHAVARGSEVSLTNFDAMWWCDEAEALWTGWPELKTGHSGEISFHADAQLNYRVCWFHSQACYIITNGGKLSSINKNPDDPSWLFPAFVNLADGGASAKAGRILKNLVGIVEGLCQDHACHGLRAGSSDDMVTNIYCHIVSMICRGNWDWTGECQIFGYVTNVAHVLSAGRALAGLKDCRQNLPAPSLDVILTPENKASVEAFAYDLFLNGPDAFHPPAGHLLKFRDVMVASLLMYFEDMEHDLGIDDAVVKRLIVASRHRNIPLSLLRSWGSDIRAKFQRDIVKSQRCSGTELEQAHAMIAILEDQLNHQNEECARLANRLESVEGRLAQIETGQSKMQNGVDLLVQHFTASPSSVPSPARKRRHVTPSPMNATTSTDSLPSSMPAPMRSIGDVLGKVSCPARPIFENFLQTPMGTLIAKLYLGKIDIDQPIEGVEKQQKSRAKKALAHALKHASEDAKLTLRQRRPIETFGPEYQEYCRTINVAAGNVAKRQYEVLKCAFEQAFPGKMFTIKSLTQCTVSSVDNMLDKLKKAGVQC